MKKMFSLILGMLGLTLLLFTCNLNVSAVAQNSVVKDGKTFEKVTTSTDVTEGNYIIAAESDEVYLGAFNTKNYYDKTADIETSTTFTFSKKDTGFTLLNNTTNKYAYHSGKNNVYEGDETLAATFNISVLDGVVSVTDTKTSRVLKYNKSANRFALYTGGQLEISLYKEKVGGPVLNEYKVSFDTMGGNVLDQIIGYEGKTLVDLPTPVKPGFKFEGWYKEQTLTNPWDLTTDTVNGDITLYAKWSESNLVQVTKTEEVVSAKYVVKSGTNYLGAFSNGEFGVTEVENDALVLTIQKSGNGFKISFENNGETNYLCESTKTQIVTTKDSSLAYVSDIYVVEQNSLEFNVQLSQSRRLAFKTDCFKAYSIADTSGSCAVELFKVKNSEIADEVVFTDNFVNETTNSSFIVKYDTETFKAFDVDLRFGATINESSYNTNAKYGVLLVRKSDNVNFTCGKQNVNSVTEFLAQNNGVKNLEATNIAKVDQTYKFSWVVTNMEEVGYSTELVAVIYCEYNGNLYFGKQISESVVSLAKKHIDNNMTEDLNALKVFENIIKG